MHCTASNFSYDINAIIPLCTMLLCVLYTVIFMVQIPFTCTVKCKLQCVILANPSRQPQSIRNNGSTLCLLFTSFAQTQILLIGKKCPQTIMSLSLLTLDTNEESVNTKFPFVQELSDILCDVFG